MASQLHLYAIVGRHVPTDRDPKPKIFRMKVFAPDEVKAKSKFWYFIRQFKRIKRANGEILGVNEVSGATASRVAAVSIVTPWPRCPDFRKEAAQGQEFRYLDALQ